MTVPTGIGPTGIGPTGIGPAGTDQPPIPVSWFLDAWERHGLDEAIEAGLVAIRRRYALEGDEPPPAFATLCADLDEDYGIALEEDEEEG